MMMSLFMLGFAVAPLFYGPASDRYGRKPIVVFTCMLFIVAGIGCALARSLPTLLMWRLVRGAGADASMTIALAIIDDLFEGQTARTKLSYVAIATTIVPMIAPRHCSPSAAGASSMPKARLPRSALIGFPVSGSPP
jgi:MFS transporter, DHA1 family, multidrug resistance protein